MRLETLTTIDAISQLALTVTGEDDGEEGDVTGNDNLLTKEIAALEKYVHKKNEGTLSLSLLGPQSWSSRVTAYVYWDGEKQQDHFWDDREMGLVKLLHPFFGSKFSCKYIVSGHLRRVSRSISKS